MLTWIAYHQQIHWYHGAVLIMYYLAYVASVLASSGSFSQAVHLAETEHKSTVEELATESSRLLGPRAIRRASSANVLDPTIRRRQISMPQDMWNRSLQAPIPEVDSRPRRTRASTVGDHLIPASSNPRASTSSDSSNSSTGVAEDYFTYLSANPTRSISPQRPLSEAHKQLNRTEFSIPEIRLAPPNGDEDRNSLQEYHPSAPLNQSHNRKPSISMSHSSSLSNTEYSCYATARQSPVSPTAPDQFSSYLSLPVPQSPQIHQELGKAPNESVYTLPIATHTVSVLSDVQRMLFPTLQNWKDKTWFARISSLTAAPLVFIFTLTLPVAEDENVKVDGMEVIDDNPSQESNTKNLPAKDYLTVPRTDSECMISDTQSEVDIEISVVHQAWCQWLVAMQAICCITFIFLIGTRFFVALCWIYVLANEMVGLLEALGIILGISESIMGLTVFALGNSIGDFVSNTAIAKMGFPTMAISACYAGPLLSKTFKNNTKIIYTGLDMVLGVGVSSTYQTWKTGKPYMLNIAPTIMISAAGLITVLMSTLIVVSHNNYHINKKLGIWMILVYFGCCAVNLAIEFGVFNYLLSFIIS
ncbi:hypothetical protein EC973_009555 [Apophysomyces ossiformis]|uniref:Sodium/calcium exchanger membrane region domain-containing protein n=1 Tax=Apophysomyces ossiformis TaxID=679940 RepID=A0A8H7EQ95_9FUNG|nr:hypothetical protein EC973_009555 [Apophysomyces ossiformis]